MTNTAGTALSQLPVHRKTTARVALFDLPAAASTLLTDCFHQFGITAATISGDDVERLKREKFDACVVALGPAAGAVIEAARSSPSNSRIVIYGLGGSAQDAMRYSKYCLNAVFQEPLERATALKLVRSTRLLVLHEFRRYVRIPVMTEVLILAANGGRFNVNSQEISAGGMSVKGTNVIDSGQQVEVSFSLLTLPRVHVRGQVTWKKANKSFGIRFDSADERRARLKEWIDGYLET